MSCPRVDDRSSVTADPRYALGNAQGRLQSTPEGRKEGRKEGISATPGKMVNAALASLARTVEVGLSSEANVGSGPIYVKSSLR